MSLPRLLFFVGVLVQVCTLARPAAAQVDPQDSLETLVTAGDMQLSLFASEPMITNPAAIDVDSHGRVWVAQIEFFRIAENADTIKVLEDSDGDGRADKETVFAEGVDQPMSICVAGDKVYVLTSPDLWVYEDRDGDLVADGPPTKLLTGFHGPRHDHGAHGFILGPDHKWYLAMGDLGLDVTGPDGSRVANDRGVMMRGEFDGTQLEEVAENFRNPYEICVSSFGESFTSDNDNDGNESTRVCWILEGGDYGWFGHPPFHRLELDRLVPPGTPYREHWHFRGHMPGYVPATVRTGYGAPCGMCFYEGDAFGPHYQNAPLHTDAGARVCRMYRHENEGAGMVATSETIVASTEDNYFRPVDVCAGPDGSIFVADWYDGTVGWHAFDNPQQGRIYRLTPQGGLPPADDLPPPGPYETVPAAIAALASPNLDTQFQARERLLAEGAASIEPLAALLPPLEGNDSLDASARNLAARAMWVLDRIGGEGRERVAEYLASPDDGFRALAARILRRRGEEYAAEILALAEDDSAEVRREVLLLIGALPGEAAEEALYRAAAMYRGEDRYLLEAIHIAAGEGERRRQLYGRLAEGEVVDLSRLPLLLLLAPLAAIESLEPVVLDAATPVDAAQRIVSLLALHDSLEAGRLVRAVAADDQLPVELRLHAFDRLAAQLHGHWRALAREAETQAALRRALAEPPLAAAALALLGENQLAALEDDVVAMALDDERPTALRSTAVAIAANFRSDLGQEMVLTLLAAEDPELQQAAIEALARWGEIALAREALCGERYPAELRGHLTEQLAESYSGALLLDSLLESGDLPEELAALVVRAAAESPDPLIRSVLGLNLSDEQRSELLGDSPAAEEIMALTGDAARGREVFFHSDAQCASCHAIAGEGGQVGPELSMIGRKYAARPLLDTILDPSAGISPEYKLYTAYTEDGQVAIGFLVEREGERVVLRDLEGHLRQVTIAASEDLIEQEKSQMPDGVLRGISAQEAADLLAFLGEQRDQTTPVETFQILGPFGAAANDFDDVLAPEETLADPDLEATYATLGGREIGWQQVGSDGLMGFPGIDTAAFDRRRQFRHTYVAHYLLVYAHSLSEQPVELLVGSDDCVKVWVNGELVHRNQCFRPVRWADDVVPAQLQAGRNVIVLKVVTIEDTGGAALGIRSEQPVDLSTE